MTRLLPFLLLSARQSARLRDEQRRAAGAGAVKLAHHSVALPEPRWRVALALLVGSLAPSVAAQARPDLAARIRAAAIDDDHHAFVRLGRGFILLPIGDIVDATLSLREEFGTGWPGLLRALLESRRHELLALWRDQPRARLARTPVFVTQVGTSSWVRLHAQGDAAERADVEAIARFLRADDPTLDAGMRDPRVESGSSAATLQRIAARAAWSREHAVASVLRRVDATFAELTHANGRGDDPLTAFALVELLTAGDRRIRARAAVMLRLALRLELPGWLRRAVADDQAVRPLTFSSVRRIDDADVDTVIAMLADDTVELPSLGNPGTALSGDARRTLARALIRVGLARAALPNDARAFACFRGAAALGAEEAVTVLAIAVNTADPRIAGCVLAAMSGLPMAANAVDRVAPLVIALLDHPAPVVATLAAQFASHALTVRAEPELLEDVAVRALAVLEEDAANLGLQQSGPRSCGLGPEPIGAPDGFRAQLVYGAARAGAPRLLEPLLAELRRLQAGAAPADGPAIRHRWFVLQCLGLLAPSATEAQARQLHGLLAGNSKSGPQAAGREELLVQDIVFGIFPCVPEDLLGWYDERLVDPVNQRNCAAVLSRSDSTRGADRVRRLLGLAHGAWSPYSTLYLSAPDLLVECWDAGAEPRGRAVTDLGGLMAAHFDRVVQMVADGTLPREFATAAYARIGSRRPGSLAELALVLPFDDTAAVRWQPGLIPLIRAAVTTDRGLRVLRRLAASPLGDVALAAARRALSCGGAGRSLATETVVRLSSSGDLEQRREAVRFAVEAEIVPPELPKLLGALRRSQDWNARMIADAAELKFAGLKPLGMRAGYPADAIGLAAIDVGVDTLRTAFREQPQLHLLRLLARCTAVTRANGLLLAAELDHWERDLEASILRDTTHADPQVRRAAYLALRSRDPELWQCTWIVHECVFDPDAEVRALAR